MLRPRFTVRTFLILCLVLGAVVLPQARKWHIRRVEAQEVKAKRIGELEKAEMDAMVDLITASVRMSNGWYEAVPLTQAETAAIDAAEKRVAKIAAELAELKGR